MTEKQCGAPSTTTAKYEVRSADKHSPSQDITFSSVILRALDARPQNEDKIRGFSP